MNPVRAKMAESLQESEFTSVFDRITGKRGREKVGKTENLKTEVDPEVWPSGG